MLTTEVNGIRSALPVAGIPGNLGKRETRVRRNENRDHSQPVHLLIMSETKDELIHNSIGAHCAAN